MASRQLRIDTDGVDSAGAIAAAAPTQARHLPPVVTPCAADATSVQVATRAASRIGALGLATAAADLTSEAAAERLRGDADAYDSQEAGAATTLSAVTAVASITGRPPNVPIPQPAAPPEPAAAPAGIEPTTGHQIAEVIYNGPGPHAALTVAANLESTAEHLEQAAATVTTAGTLTADSWTSQAADAATEHLATLQNSYTAQAAQARTLARGLRSHADDFSRARAAIPPPQRFTDLETRLQAAYAANAHPASMGRYTQQIAELQRALAEANNDATTGYHRYRDAAQSHFATMSPAANADPGRYPGKHDDGNGGAEHSDDAGHDPQAAADQPSPPQPQVPTGTDGAGAAAAQLMGTVLPAVLGGATGAAGGVLGALSGAGQQVQQMGSQLANGLAQGAATNPSAPNSGAGNPGAGSHPPQLPKLDDLDSGGPQPGDMEPASGGGGAALATPASAAAAPASAPASFSATPASSSVAPAGVSGAGASMMPPVMPMAPHSGGGSGQDDGRLYRERRVRIETPPNSEPVKGRREARRARGEQGGEVNR